MAAFGYNIAPGTSAESLALRRRLAEQLMQQGTSGAPIGHWLQGVNRVAQGALGGYLANKADKGDAARNEQTQRMLSGLFGLGDESAEMPTAQPASYAPTDIRPPQMGGDMTARIVSAESGGNATARNPRSSATGRGQFIDSTWLDVMGRHKPDLIAGKSRDEILNMRTDPALSDDMTGVYSREVAAALKGAGIDPTPGNVYLGYHLGPGGATKVIKSDASTPLAKILPPEVMAANPHLQNMTAGRAQRWAQGKMGGAPAEAPAAETAPRIASKDKRRLRQAIGLLSNPDTAAIGQKILADYLTQGSGDTSAIKEFRLAQSQGYEGTFLDYQKDLKTAGAAKTNIQVGGKKLSEEISKGVAEDLLTQRTAARDAVTSLEATAEARGLLDSGIISGFGSNFMLGMGKALQAAGINVADDPIANTEAFVATRAQEVGRIIKLFGAGTGLSDADRAFATKAAAGDIALNETSIRKILEINERAARNVIKSYNESLSKLPEGTTEYDLSIQLPDSLAEKPKKRKAPQVGQSIDAEQLQGLPDNTIIEDDAGNQFRVMGGKAIPVQ